MNNSISLRLLLFNQRQFAKRASVFTEALLFIVPIQRYVPDMKKAILLVAGRRGAVPYRKNRIFVEAGAHDSPYSFIIRIRITAGTQKVIGTI